MAGDFVLKADVNALPTDVDRDALTLQYERIYAAYGAAFARLAGCYESRPEAREDLLQEILVAVWKALPGFRGDCSEKTFAFRVAHNRCLTHVWKRSKASASAGELPELPDPRGNPEALAIDTRRRESLLAAIRALPVNYAQAITLALEDLSTAEIASVLGISENNAAVRLNRARNALRKLLGGHA